MPGGGATVFSLKNVKDVLQFVLLVQQFDIVSASFQPSSDCIKTVSANQLVPPFQYIPVIQE
jgi:hypothetical protein